MIRTVVFGLLLTTAPAALACPMADAAAFAEALEKVQAAPGTHLALTVDGMHCGSCSSMITKTLLQMPGVHAAAVDYQTGRTEIAFDGEKLKPEMVRTAIEALGFRSTPSTT